jgi:hypothetical protein
MGLQKVSSEERIPYVILKVTYVEFETLPTSSLISNIIEYPFAPNPFTTSARRQFRFCVPDEWYRRTKSRNLRSSSSIQPSESTIRRLASLEESNEEDEGTARVRETSNVENALATKPASPRSVSQNRLSSIFDNWLRPAGNNSSAIFTPDGKSVSEPKLVQDQIMIGVPNHNEQEQAETEAFDSAGFEQMVVCLFRPSLVQSYS